MTTEQTYTIIDKNGIEMPDHYTGRKRTYDEAKRLIDRLNKNGEHKPYKMITHETRNNSK